MILKTSYENAQTPKAPKNKNLPRQFDN